MLRLCLMLPLVVAAVLLVVVWGLLILMLTLMVLLLRLPVLLLLWRLRLLPHPRRMMIAVTRVATRGPRLLLALLLPLAQHRLEGCHRLVAFLVVVRAALRALAIPEVRSAPAYPVLRLVLPLVAGRVVSKDLVPQAGLVDMVSRVQPPVLVTATPIMLPVLALRVISPTRVI